MLGVVLHLVSLIISASVLLQEVLTLEDGFPHTLQKPYNPHTLEPLSFSCGFRV